MFSNRLMWKMFYTIFKYEAYLTKNQIQPKDNVLSVFCSMQDIELIFLSLRYQRKSAETFHRNRLCIFLYFSYSIVKFKIFVPEFLENYIKRFLSSRFCGSILQKIKMNESMGRFKNIELVYFYLFPLHICFLLDVLRAH